MIPATLKKVVADLWVNKARSVLVALSIAVGVFAVGIVASALVIVKNDMAADYLASNPHTARIYCQDFDDTLLGSLGRLPEVEAVDASYNLWLKIAGRNGRQYPINLNSLTRLADIQVDRLIHEAGARTLAKGEIFLERQGAEGLGLDIGDSVTLTMNDGRTHTLRLAGTVHDVFANPFKFNTQTSGYVTPATMESLGGSRLNNFVSVITTGSHTDATHVREMADRVAEKITASGYTVLNINAAKPGQHPAQATVDTVLALLGALSALVVFLSAFLVTNTVSALMGQQIRQIGVMKALGATFFQVMGLYLGLVLAFGALALLIAVPLGGLAAYGLTRWLISMLNANPSPFVIPTLSLALQFVIGLAVPVAGALVPVFGGARRTVRQAITSYGLEAAGRANVFDRVLETFPWLPRPLMLSLRNTFRRKARLALTLVTLILGGAIFIAMFGVRDSLYWEIEQSFGYYESDVNVTFAQAYSLAKVQAAMHAVSGVVAVEGWQVTKANVLRADGESSDQIAVYAPPSSTRLVKPVMIAGRWLLPADGNAIVVDQHFVDLRPEVKVGDTIRVWLNDDAGEEHPAETSFKVVGIFRLAGNFPNPYAYLNREALEQMAGAPGHVNNLRLVTDRHDPARQEEVLKAVKDRLVAAGLEATLQTGNETLAQQRSVINILITLLLLMGLLIAVVGGLGLMGTMGMNVLERTREIGVMRSIGAENGTIFQLVVIEGAMIGLISWGLSVAAAVPINQLLDVALGKRLMTVPIVYMFPTQGMAIWLGVVLALSALASLLPARSAVRLTVRDVLAYE